MNSLSKSLVYLTAILLLTFSSSCKQKSEPAKTKVRIAQMLLHANEVMVSFQNDKDTINMPLISYATVSDTISLKPGTYSVSVSDSNNRMLLNKKIGMGKSGRYTLALLGLPLADQQTNKSTFKNDMLKFVEGEVARDVNAYLPQVLILNEEYYGASTKANVRWTHAVPALSELTGYLVVNTKDTVPLHTTTYPKTSKSVTTNPGRVEAFWTLGSKKRKVAETNFTLDPQSSVSLFLVPLEDGTLDSLQVLKTSTKNAPID